ncbi:MAG: nucleotidyl transferase AbiEii/AbiGii toxin family protein [Acholeplasmataceae bacterium]|nr:nucleotidyl transferase AbiEii/AbiGii toxin family protein [Acholeplasmataceae bacterium]
MHLHTNKKDFKELIIATASHTPGLQNHQVEKDYYVSLFLKELSKIDNNVEIVFKGGTSLSKCYDVIDRFSEDIDLTIKFPNVKAGRGLRKRLKENIIATIDKLGMKFLNPDEVQSDRDFNHYDIEFERLFESTPEMIPHIKIETIVVYKPYPCLKKDVSNYITKYLSKLEEGPDLIDRYDLETFEMSIQSINRTFIDKLFALCDYHLEKTYDRYSRHIYDIHMICNSEFLDKKVVTDITDDVISDRQRLSVRNPSAKPGSKPKEILKEIIDKKVFESDYNEITSGFIYKKVSYETCIDSLKAVLEYKLVPEVIKEYE